MVLLAAPTRCGPYVKADRGCRGISGRCVDCHLPVCLEEVPGGIATLRRERKQMLVRGFRQKGATIRTIANTPRMSHRTVFRVLEPSQEVRRKRWRDIKRRQREGA